MEWLAPPFEWYHPEPDRPFTLRVIRYEVGWAQRPIDEPPGLVVRPTIRFHLPPEDKSTGPPYVDFTNRMLIQRVTALYDELSSQATERPELESIPILEALSPARPRPLTLRITRRGRRLDTTYEVEVVGA